jgi:hypothetical protein
VAAVEGVTDAAAVAGGVAGELAAPEDVAANKDDVAAVLLAVLSAASLDGEGCYCCPRMRGGDWAASR